MFIMIKTKKTMINRVIIDIELVNIKSINSIRIDSNFIETNNRTYQNITNMKEIIKTLKVNNLISGVKI